MKDYSQSKTPMRDHLLDLAVEGKWSDSAQLKLERILNGCAHRSWSNLIASAQSLSELKLSASHWAELLARHAIELDQQILPRWVASEFDRSCAGQTYALAFLFCVEEITWSHVTTLAQRLDCENYKDGVIWLQTIRTAFAQQ